MRSVPLAKLSLTIAIVRNKQKSCLQEQVNKTKQTVMPLNYI